jgi:2-dehydropantoate 2-reductase
MRVVVVGAGAMGSLFAASLARTGEEVWVYDPWREHVEAIRRAGLAVAREGGEDVVALRATTDPTEPGFADLVLVFVKHADTRQAAADARPLLHGDTTVVTVQNGLGNVEILAAAVPPERLVYGLTTLTSELTGPGRIEASFKGRGETYLWPLDGRPGPRAEAAAALFNRAGIRTELAPDIQARIWKKLIVNCGLNTVCALTGLTVGALAARPEAWPLLDAIAGEIVDVGRRKGIPLDAADARRFLRAVAAEARDHAPSMLVDVRHGRRTEIDCLNAAVVREGDALGAETPTNRAVTALIRLLEAGAGPAARD